MGTIDKSTNELIDSWNELAQTAVEFGLLKKAHDDGVDIDEEAFDMSEKKLAKTARKFSVLCELYLDETPTKKERKR